MRTGRRVIIGATEIQIQFINVFLTFRNDGNSNETGRKLRPNFTLSTHAKVRVGEMSE